MAVCAMTGDGSVNYTVKELLSMLEKTLADRMDRIAVSVDEVKGMLALKASEVRVDALERRIGEMEKRLAGSAAVSVYQRWIFGTIGVGVLGAISTLVWLASGGH